MTGKKKTFYVHYGVTLTIEAENKDEAHNIALERMRRKCRASTSFAYKGIGEAPEKIPGGENEVVKHLRKMSTYQKNNLSASTLTMDELAKHFDVSMVTMQAACENLYYRGLVDCFTLKYEPETDYVYLTEKGWKDQLI